MGRAGRRVTVLRNDGHPGLAGSRNAGLKRADTELIASCDDDDAWLPRSYGCGGAIVGSTPRCWWSAAASGY